MLPLGGLGGLGALVLLVQAVAAIHALRTGRPYWWFYVIIFLPGIGAVIYLVSEVLPDTRRSPELKRLGANLIQLVDPGRDLRKLQEDLEVSDTFKNRQALARGYVTAGRHEEAIAQYQKCLTGTFQDDPCATLELAHTYFLAGRYGEAIATVDRLKQASERFRPEERELLLARTLEESGDKARALERYAAIIERSSGEEARCRYALLLEEAGQIEKARETFRQIVLRARRSPHYYRRAQKHWVRIARQHLAK